jgi:site-specific recombinase XerD
MSESWKEDKFVKNWFELLGNKRTIENYSGEFPKFLKYIQAQTPYKTPSQIIQSRLEHLTTQDLLKRRYWENQTVKYKNYLESKNLRMATVKSHIRTVMSFFSKTGVKLSFSRGELKVNPSEKDKVIREWIPSNEEIRLLYRMAKDSRDRAILLVLYQSGFSEVDVAAMKIEDFEFINEKGEWAIGATEDVYHARLREKTNILQQSCISREALEEIRIMLQSRGFPQKGTLFVSFRSQPLGVRGINDAVKEVVARAFSAKAKAWQTKHLRDAFMNGLLQARLPQELKDVMVGHKRQGARDSYAITELTIKTAYQESFKFLTINGYGSANRKLEELSQKTDSLASVIAQQQQKINEREEKFEKLDKQFAETQLSLSLIQKVLTPELLTRLQLNQLHKEYEEEQKQKPSE